jgi:hypothetical protein
VNSIEREGDEHHGGHGEDDAEVDDAVEEDCGVD